MYQMVTAARRALGRFVNGLSRRHSGARQADVAAAWGRCSIKRWIAASLSGTLLAFGAALGPAHAQPISSPVTIDFDSESFSDSGDLGSPTFTQSGFSITYSAQNWGEDTNEGESGSQALVPNAGSGAGETITISTTGGEEFSLTSFWWDHFGFGGGAGGFGFDITSVEGRRDGSTTGTISSGFPTARFATFTFDAANLDPSDFLDNVDQVIITGNFFGVIDSFEFGTPIGVAPAPTVTLSGGGSAVEGTASRTITATLSAAASADTTVNLAYTGTASGSGTDYTAASSLTILAGATTGTTDITVVSDSVVEADETVIVDISSVSGGDGATEDGTQQQTFTLTNDDAAAVTIADVAVNENAGTATVTLTLDNAVDGGFDVDVSTSDNTATTADGDYTAVTSATETFAGTAGETETFTVTLGADTKVEADEIIDVAMSGLVPVTVASGDIDVTDTSTVTLTNDDTATVTIADASGNEDDGAVTFTVTLDNAVDGGFDVDVSTADNTATLADSDYTAVTSQTLTFAGTASETETFTVTPTLDAVAEADETVTVSMSNLSPVTVAGGDIDITDGATLTIFNDDSAPTLAIDDLILSEGDSGTSTATFTVTMTGDSSLAATVDYATSDGSATAGDDYTATSGTLTFPAFGDGLTRTFGVVFSGDVTVEGNETVTLTLSNPVNATLSDAAGVLTLTNDDFDSTAPSGYTVAFDDTVYGADETGSVSFTMASAEAGATLDYSITSSGGGTPVMGSVPNISASEQVTGIDVSGLNDGTLTVSVTLTDTASNTGSAQTDTATLDTAPPAFSKAFAPSSIVVSGTSTLTFTLDNTAVAAMSSSLDFTDTFPAGLTVASPADASTTCTGGTLTAVPGSGSASYTGGTVGAGASCTISVDVTASTTGSYVNTSGDLTSSQGNSGTASDTLTVAEPSLVIGDATVDEDAGTATFTVTLSAPPAVTTTVDYATSDSTASAGEDYTATSGTLTFVAGDDSESFTVAITDDTIDEAATEEFLVTLSNSVNATISGATGVGTITDNDSAPVISIADATVAEDAGTASFTVSLSNASSSTVTVNFATSDGTAVAGSDYTSNSGVLTFSPGDVSETISVVIADDAIDEIATESYTVTLSSATNATISSPSAIGGITDNDGVPDIAIADGSVGEGDGTATFTVSLDAASGQTVTVDFATADGTALAGSDYTANSGTLTFVAGNVSETITVVIIDDALSEASEDFTIDLSNAVNGSILDAAATGTITDNDPAPSLSIDDVTVAEDGGAASFTVSLDAASGQTVTVDFATADGTAQAGSDYTAASGMLSFAPGDVSETITVTITDDGLDETAEGFTVDLSNAVNATIGDADGDGTITDNDSAPLISIADVTVDEDAGAASFTVSLDAASGQAVTVDFATADASATAGDDYTANSGMLTFVAGDVSETITVAITDDGLDEAAESFTVDLSNAVNATISDASANGSITDDDAAPSIVIADATVGEGAGAASFTVSLDAASGQTITVDFATTDATAVAGSDYTATSGTLTFIPGDVSETVIVTITDDALDEVSEGFTVDLSSPVNASLGDAAGAGTITDNDSAPSLFIDDVTVAEDAGTATFTVSLDAASGQTVTVDFATADGTAVAGSDYTATSGMLSFAPGDVSETITVVITDDGVVEGDETYTVSLSNPVNATVSDDTGAGSITNDDAAPTGYTAAFDADPVTNALAGSTSFTFTGAQVGADYAFTIASSGGGADVTGSGTISSASEQVMGIDVSGLGDGVLTLTAALTDTFGNAGADVTDTAQKETSLPDVTITTASADPVSGTFSITMTFTEDVTGFVLGDLTVGNGAASNFNATSASVYTADITPAADGTVTVDIAAGVAQDSAGNANTAATPFSIESDGTPPDVTITTASADPVSGTFSITMTFTEDVTGFAVGDLTVGNGAASNFNATSASVYTADITPAADGTVTVDIAAGVAQDSAGNANTAATPFSIQSDATRPDLTITTASVEVSGPFEATFTFTEDVTGFDLSDIVVDNGAAAGLSGSGAVYTATITPATIGALFIDVAEGAAQDSAGNLSFAGEASVDVVADAPTVTLVLSSAIADPGDVAGTATLSNPGSDPLAFTAAANVNWVDVTPGSGSIPSLGELDLTISLNDNVNALAPGTYAATVTVSVGGGASTTTAATGSGLQSTVQNASQILVEIPISLTVEERFGSVELVATTPSGASGEASFAYVSDLNAFDGVTLTTANGRASIAAGEDILFGAYAITQSAPAGWRVESIACAGDADGGSSFDPATGQAVIDLDPGEALVCTYENVRDEDAVRLATQRAILNFMARRADRIVAAAPDFSRRFSERDTPQRGAFSADMDGSGRSTMAFSASLAGLRNAAQANTPNIAGVTNYERPFAEHWDVWVAAELASVRDDRAGDDASSDFAIAQLGLDRQVSDTLILGLMVQYDWMDEVSAQINTAAGAIAGARVEGEGWMAGPYGVWRIRDQLVFDALAMYGTSENTVNPLGLYEDDFETDRFMLRANLTGEFQSGNWRLRPQANLTHFEETQSAYTDSLNIAIPEQTLSLGRFTAGPQVAWRNQTGAGGYLEIATTVRAVWDYQAAELLNDAGVLTGGDDDLRADARLGLSAGFASGVMLRLEAGFAGLGVGDFEATTGRFELRIPFGARGRGGGGAAAGAPLASGAQAQCEDPAGLGFAHAAGQTQACDRGGFGRQMR